MGRKNIFIGILFTMLIHESFSHMVPSDDCSHERCERVGRCPKGEYLAKADGEKQCCDECRKYAGLDEHCCKTQLCSPKLHCDENEKCVAGNKCSMERCKPMRSCPSGHYLVPGDGIDVCCDRCQEYADLGEPCNQNIKCAHNLICTPSNICAIPAVNCAGVSCSTRQTCPVGSYRVKANRKTECCDVCRRFAQRGEMCYHEKKCAPGLFCGEHVCEPVVDCSHVKCASIQFCPAGKYLVPKDMIRSCCDTCRKYSGVGQFCDAQYPCAKGLVCNKNNICEEPVVDCTIVLCRRVDSCEYGEYLVHPDGKKRCCRTCRKYSKFGEPCDRDQKCEKNLICNADNVCASVKICPKGTYLVPQTDECVKYAGYGESCARIACGLEFYCNIGKRCTPIGNPDCALARCIHVDRCPAKEYLVPADGITVCCNDCERYADEGQWCLKDRKCLPGLKCNSRQICEAPIIDCRQVHCADIRGCPKGQHLVKAGKKDCCSFCRDNSDLGQPCSHKKPCNEGLFCNRDDVCEKINCRMVECKKIRKCPKDSYLVRGNGITRCCNSCRKYAEDGEYCDSTHPCEPRILRCDEKNDVCVPSCRRPPCSSY